MLMRLYVPHLSSTVTLDEGMRTDIIGGAINAIIAEYGHARTWTYEISIPKDVSEKQKQEYMLVKATILETNGPDTIMFDKIAKIIKSHLSCDVYVESATNWKGGFVVCEPPTT